MPSWPCGGGDGDGGRRGLLRRPLGKTARGEAKSVYAHDLTLVVAMTTNEEGKSFINSS